MLWYAHKKLPFRRRNRKKTRRFGKVIFGVLAECFKKFKKYCAKI